MNVIRRMDRSAFQFDFLVHKDTGDYYGELEQRGCKVIKILGGLHSASFGRQLFAELSGTPQYDIVHAHMGFFSGYILFVARLAGIRHRFMHSHNDDRRWKKAGFVRSLYQNAMLTSIAMNTTRRIAVSDAAALSFFGSNYRQDPRCSIMHCGIDLPLSADRDDRSAIRETLGITADQVVLGHVGRLTEQKNHALLLEIMAVLKKRSHNAVLLLVGDGELRPMLEERARELGIAELCRFAGVRSNVQALLSAMDVFVFPSLWEGMGLALIEAQAAGLPCVISDRVPTEADVVPALVTRLAVGEPAESWSSAIERISPPSPAGRKEALDLVLASDFNIDVSARALCDAYVSSVGA